MPRYHFNLHNSIGFVPDEEGRDLPDLETAHGEAVKGARSIIAEEVLGGRLDLGGRIEVTDGAGKSLVRVDFADVIDTGESRAPMPAGPG